MSNKTTSAKFKCIPGSMAKVQHDLLQECSTLYSTHYGKWSEVHQYAGKSIKLSTGRIREWLEIPSSRIYLARIDDELIGYCIASISKHRKGKIAWVTQLVIHSEWRNKGISTKLLFSIWTMSDFFSWGVLTSSPYAIRALEKATRRRCHPERIYNNHRLLINFGVENVCYLEDSAEKEITKNESKINTKFFADHSLIRDMINNVISDRNPWLLGSLQEGWEWFAFTFKDQQQIELTQVEIEDMLDVADQVTQYAYSRMQLKESQHVWSSTKHHWAKHTKHEVEFIENNCNLQKNKTVLDIGCGIGRHCVELAKKGYSTTGIDYNDNFLKLDKSDLKGQVGYPEFIKIDCRDINLDKKYDVILCLYDVIGTYVSNQDNAKILNSIYNHLNKDGFALISVMNFELTKHNAKLFFSIKKDYNKLLDLPASSIMESTGGVFNPAYYMVDTDSNIVYRKEQFVLGDDLPDELIVRDKRFENSEITELCENAQLDVVWSRYVSAGSWNTSLRSTDNGAKEILMLLKKK